jgi:hypothetical protein
MKISVGLPVYDCKVMSQQVACLLTETSLAFAMGDTLNVRFLPSCTNLAFGRNQIVKDFLDSDDEKLVFLDADVTFKPGELLRLAHHPVDFVGGAYRLKQERELYPIYLLNEPRPQGPGGLIEVAMVPTGFLALSRDVFSRYRSHYPGRDYAVHGNPAYCYFQIPYKDGALYTEDSYFCREWREKGEKIYLDPELHLTHWQGNIPYPGHVGNFYRKLQNRAPAPLEASA